MALTISGKMVCTEVIETEGEEKKGRERLKITG